MCPPPAATNVCIRVCVHLQLRGSAPARQRHDHTSEKRACTQPPTCGVSNNSALAKAALVMCLHQQTLSHNCSSGVKFNQIKISHQFITLCLDMQQRRVAPNAPPLTRHHWPVPQGLPPHVGAATPFPLLPAPVFSGCRAGKILCCCGPGNADAACNQGHASGACMLPHAATPWRWQGQRCSALQRPGRTPAQNLQLHLLLRSLKKQRPISAAAVAGSATVDRRAWQLRVCLFGSSLT